MHTNGLTELAPHKIAALVTFLVHDLGASGREVSLPAGFALERFGAEDLQPYRDLYRRVGADWLWFSRLRMPDDELREILGSPEVHALALVGPEGAIGLLELDFREVEAPELAFFGLVPAAVGGGFGRGLMGEAGPEAIMPLARGPDGRLGVQSAGGRAVNVVMNITTPDVQGFQRSQAQVAAQVSRALARGQRNR